MTSRAGVGRGRGIKIHTPEVNPGFGLKIDEGERASPMEHLSLLINNMACEDNKLEIEPVKRAFIEATTTKERLSSAVQLIVSRCLKEEMFVKCAVTMCSVLNDVKVEDFTLRNAFLGLLQATYKQKDELRKEQPPTKWIGCVSLLAQSIRNLRMPDGSPMTAVVKVCLESILLCLDSSATDEELECAAIQILLIGDILCKHNEADKVDELRRAISEVITNARGSEGTRKKLIEGLVLCIGSRHEKAASSTH